MSVIEPTALDDWRQELSPWLAALMEIKHALKVELPAMPTSEILESLWIRFETRDGMSYGPLQWAMILEAWELLDLLVRVDAVAGWQCLFSVVAPPAVQAGGIKSDTAGPFLQSLFLVMRRMIGEDDQPWAPPSPEFVRVKQLLLNAWARGHGGRAFDRGREGHIVVKPEVILSIRFHGQPLPLMMQRILQLAIVSRTLAPRDEEITPEGSDPMAGGDPEAEPKVRQRHAVFCFETVDVGLLEQPAMNEVLNHLFHLLSEGVRITELVLEHVFMTQLRFSVAGSFFREMLGVCSARGRGLKRFEYSCGDF